MKLKFSQARARIKCTCSKCNGNGVIPGSDGPNYWDLCKVCMGTGLMNHPRKSKKL